MVPAPEVKLSAKDIRTRFNAAGYHRRAQDDTDPSVSIGQILDNGPAPAWAPKGARSQMIEYHNAQGRTIAWAHQYGFPNGRPIPKSRPDPKFLFEDGTRYKYDPNLDSPA
jgi:hypothetical protein